MQVDLDQQIPPQLYQAVAEVLAWVYRIEQNGAKSPQDPLK
ncbi:MAG: EscU/YscU/HrcU family type III secretion system export apparatus switch protein [Acidithiobacillus ferrooxidans]